MANQNITFDVASGTPYEANLTINGGANFSNIFTVKNPDSTAFDLTDYSGSSQMTKSVAVGSTGFPDATFTVGFTSAVDGKLEISLGSTATRSLAAGRYVYDILVNSASSSNTTDVLETAISVGSTAGIGTTTFTLNKVTNVAVGDSISIGDKLTDVPVVTVSTGNTVEVGTAFTSSSQILPGTAVTFSRVSTASTIYRIVSGSIIVKAGISSAPS
jgi:hypothetical protein